MALLRTDEQTIEDLGIFGKKSGRGIYDIYNRASTRGGETLLGELFRNPLSDKEAINRRSSIIESLAKKHITFPYNVSLFDLAEKYLTDTEDNARNKRGQQALGRKKYKMA